MEALKEPAWEFVITNAGCSSGAFYVTIDPSGK